MAESRVKRRARVGGDRVRMGKELDEAAVLQPAAARGCRRKRLVQNDTVRGMHLRCRWSDATLLAGISTV